jgi:hypothetical protein
VKQASRKLVKVLEHLQIHPRDWASSEEPELKEEKLKSKNLAWGHTCLASQQRHRVVANT